MISFRLWFCNFFSLPFSGRAGNAYSLVAGDELAYFIDLQLFLGNSVQLSPQSSKPGDQWHNVLGSTPQHIYDEYSDLIESWHDKSLDLFNMKKVSNPSVAQAF